MDCTVVIALLDLIAKLAPEAKRRLENGDPIGMVEKLAHIEEYTETIRQQVRRLNNV